jgi:hypothetical protein
MGLEVDNTAVKITDSWILDMAGVYHHAGVVDDNDGIYLHSQAAGQTITLAGGVVSGTQDDGIDTLGSTIQVSDYIVRDIFDKASSVFSGSAQFDRVLIADADLGISAKGTGNDEFRVTVDRSTIVRVNTAVRIEDKDDPDPNVKITCDVSNSILLVRAGGTPIRTDYDPDDIRVNYSILPTAWDHAGSGNGNLFVDPLFVDADRHDFRLTQNSPAVNMGDPARGPDPDGSRLDMGVFPFTHAAVPRGDFDRDGVVDADDIDLLCQAILTEDQSGLFDLDENGRNSSADLDVMIEGILQSTFGDANLDGRFDSGDLVAVFQAGQYEDALTRNSTWRTGDWNCDGEFSTADLVVAFQKGRYET